MGSVRQHGISVALIVCDKREVESDVFLGIAPEVLLDQCQEGQGSQELDICNGPFVVRQLCEDPGQLMVVNILHEPLAL